MSILRWWQQCIKPNVGPSLEWGLCDRQLHIHEAGLTYSLKTHWTRKRLRQPHMPMTPNYPFQHLRPPTAHRQQISRLEYSASSQIQPVSDLINDPTLPHPQLPQHVHLREKQAFPPGRLPHTMERSQTVPALPPTVPTRTESRKFHFPNSVWICSFPWLPPLVPWFQALSELVHVTQELSAAPTSALLWPRAWSPRWF